VLRDWFRWDNPFPRTGSNLVCGSHFIKFIAMLRTLRLCVRWSGA
jgi:hypothetical protein